MVTSRSKTTNEERKRKNATDLLRLVQEYADDWKPSRDRAANRGIAKATASDADALKTILLGIGHVLEGKLPWSDIRRMHVALEQRDRGVIERRRRVVDAVHWAMWVWERTERPDRRREVAGDLLEMLRSEQPRFKKLSVGDVLDVLRNRRKGSRAPRV